MKRNWGVLGRISSKAGGIVNKALQKLGAIMTPAEEQAAKHLAFRRGTYVQAGTGLHKDRRSGVQHMNYEKVKLENGSIVRRLVATVTRRVMWFKLDKHQKPNRMRENSRRLAQMQFYGMTRLSSKGKAGVFHSNTKVLPLFTTNVYEGA